MSKRKNDDSNEMIEFYQKVDFTMKKLKTMANNPTAVADLVLNNDLHQGIMDIQIKEPISELPNEESDNPKPKVKVIISYYTTSYLIY